MNLSRQSRDSASRYSSRGQYSLKKKMQMRMNGNKGSMANGSTSYSGIDNDIDEFDSDNGEGDLTGKVAARKIQLKSMD